jgi:hypothetical protein
MERIVMSPGKHEKSKASTEAHPEYLMALKAFSEPAKS